MAALTKADLEARVHELTGQLQRAETMLEVCRIRTGELFVALPEDIAETLTPISSWQTRYTVIDRIVDHATNLAIKASSGQSIDLELEGLIGAVQSNESYWLDVAAERDKRKKKRAEAKAKSRTNKREKTNAEG